MANKFVVEEVRRLSQEEGLSDTEIAELMGCTRNTINRTRTKNNIPRANIMNRKDKVYICTRCKKKVYIRRRDPRKLYCEDCEKLG